VVLAVQGAPALSSDKLQLHISRLHLPAPTRLLVSGSSFPIVTRDKSYWSTRTPLRSANRPEIRGVIVGRQGHAPPRSWSLVPPGRPSEMKSRGSKTPFGEPLVCRGIDTPHYSITIVVVTLQPASAGRRCQLNRTSESINGFR
jgi:hypothetical protein